MDMPALGYGTDYVDPLGSDVTKCVKHALLAGYRLIDTALLYENEAQVAEAIAENAIKDIFITTKIHPKMMGAETIASFLQSINTLRKIDLLLIHNPAIEYENWRDVVLETWRTMENLYKQGKVKYIGVSNFGLPHLEFLLKHCRIKPMVNQIEIHPMHQKRAIVNLCREHKILVNAYGALGSGKTLLENPVICKIAQKYNKTPAQICLRWSIQKGFIPLARSTNEKRIEENFNVFDFGISKKDMTLLDSLEGAAPNAGHHYNLEYPLKEKLKFAGLTLIKIKHSRKRLNDYLPAKTTYYLFGFIPILKIKRLYKNRLKRKYYLFGLLRLF
jgi:diketogulonate reductase-like aldo/keto reductase